MQTKRHRGINAHLMMNLFHQIQLCFSIEQSDGLYVLNIKDDDFGGDGWQKLEHEFKVPREAIIDLPANCGQQMIDQLWQMGLRPSVGVSSTGQDEAQKAHISDLKQVLFSLLQIGK